MNFKRVAIIGTNHISLSIALALKAQKEPPEIVGYNVKKVIADLARAKGALDRVERRPSDACQDADLVIIAVPLTDIRETFADIASHLTPGCLVTDIARLKAPVMDWAEELLPDNVTFVGGHLILNPATAGLDPLEEPDEANKDLLEHALYCFTTPPEISNVVINTLTDLAKAFDAHPFFIDVTEHDGLQAGVEGLPDLLAIALLRSTIDTPGWEEMRKLAGHRFATATTLETETTDIDERHTAAFLNREHIIRRLNVLLTELVRLRDMMSKDDAELVEKAFVEAVTGREAWLGDRARGMWVKKQSVNSDQIPSVGKQIKTMLFGERPSLRRDDEQDPRKK
ncbi:MAG: prephenate dehydrogenase/arogenate dehydrogenase family protein [Chloroflexi bacterium]|nr:prephenate dehydrogenase/arogenate dehydrogenase family protein [Chloroflexota bacterium]